MSEKKKLLEVDLYEPIQKHFTRKGYKVNGEVNDCDLTAVKEEDLIIVEAREGINVEPRIRQLTGDMGLTVKRLGFDDSPLFGPAILSFALGEVQERLVVVSRGILEDAVASTIASARRIPVLVIEPQETTQGLLDSRRLTAETHHRQNPE